MERRAQLEKNIELEILRHKTELDYDIKKVVKNIIDLTDFWLTTHSEKNWLGK